MYALTQISAIQSAMRVVLRTEKNLSSWDDMKTRSFFIIPRHSTPKEVKRQLVL